jgi:hypothetical protein
VALRGQGYCTAVRLGAVDAASAFGHEAIDVNHLPDDEIRDRLAIGFGGIAAEIALLGEGSLGGRSDVSQATGVAMGRFAAGLTDDPAPLDLDFIGSNVSAALKEALAAATTGPIAEARARAIAIVSVSIDPIRRFAVALEAAGELTGNQLRQAIEAAGFVVDVDR